MSWVMKPEDVKPCPTCDRPCWFGLHVRHPEDVDENHCPNWRLADQIKTLRAELSDAQKEVAELQLALLEALELIEIAPFMSDPTPWGQAKGNERLNKLKAMLE